MQHTASLNRDGWGSDSVVHSTLPTLHGCAVLRDVTTGCTVARTFATAALVLAVPTLRTGC